MWFFYCRGGVEINMVLPEWQTEEEAEMIETNDENYSLKGTLYHTRYMSGEFDPTDSETEHFSSQLAFGTQTVLKKSILICHIGEHFAVPSCR